MKVQVTLDENNYILSYTNPIDNLCGTLDNSLDVDVDEEFLSFKYVCNAYRVIDGVAVLDKDKLTQEVQDVINPEPPQPSQEEILKTEVEDLKTRLLEMEKLIQSLTNNSTK